jgi:hydroxyacyl-ACP dehydratase HTD2-like protein with hotdog domain
MPKFADLKPGQEIAGRSHTPDIIQLFFYNAALWNAHRIHFDEPYAKQVEGYPGLVTAGPLIGEWLAQCVVEWVGEDGRLTTIEYSNRKASYAGETIQTGATITAVDAAAREVTLDLYAKNPAGEVVAPGKATVRFA